MDKISFQNGFICGMATKGLTRSGELYRPRCWNEEGVFDCFYIDFKRGLSEFSPGMFIESIIVYDSESLPIRGAEYVSNGVYKVYCDISGRKQGVTVVNKKSTLLETAGGNVLPVFSVMFYVSGLESYVRKAYKYEHIDFSAFTLPAAAERAERSLWACSPAGIAEAAAVPDVPGALEYIDVSYW